MTSSLFIRAQASVPAARAPTPAQVAPCCFLKRAGQAFRLGQLLHWHHAACLVIKQCPGPQSYNGWSAKWTALCITCGKGTYSSKDWADHVRPLRRLHLLNVLKRHRVRKLPRTDLLLCPWRHRVLQLCLGLLLKRAGLHERRRMQPRTRCAMVARRNYPSCSSLPLDASCEANSSAFSQIPLRTNAPGTGSCVDLGHHLFPRGWHSYPSKCSKFSQSSSEFVCIIDDGCNTRRCPRPTVSDGCAPGSFLASGSMTGSSAGCSQASLSCSNRSSDILVPYVCASGSIGRFTNCTGAPEIDNSNN